MYKRQEHHRYGGDGAFRHGAALADAGFEENRSIFRVFLEHLPHQIDGSRPLHQMCIRDSF